MGSGNLVDVFLALANEWKKKTLHSFVGKGRILFFLFSLVFSAFSTALNNFQDFLSFQLLAVVKSKIV